MSILEEITNTVTYPGTITANGSLAKQRAGPVEFQLPAGTDTIVTRNGGLTFNVVGFNAGDSFVLRRGGDGREPSVYFDDFRPKHTPQSWTFTRICWILPAEATVACAGEGDRYWRVPTGTTMPLSSKSTGSGMYEVRLGSGDLRGACTVTGDGDVKLIMND